MFLHPQAVDAYTVNHRQMVVNMLIYQTVYPDADVAAKQRSHKSLKLGAFVARSTKTGEW